MKENFTRFFLFVFVFFSLQLAVKEVHASHSMGADLTYRCLGGNNYEITLSFYRDCVGVPADQFADILFTSSCYPSFNVTIFQIAGTGQEISPICPNDTTTCNGGSFTGIQEYIYRGVVTLPGPCADWNFSYNLCCRNAAITNINNPSSTLMYIFATLDNTITPCNNSPVFSNKPVPFACLGQQYCFNHGGFDPDGDSLVYTMMTPYDMSGLPVSYMAPFSPTQPLSSSPAVTFNPQTGDICMTPTNLEVTVMAVLVEEYRNGVLIGSVERDIQLTVINCNNVLPTLSGMDGTNNFSRTVCAGAPQCFTIYSADADALQNTTVTWDTGIPAGTFTTTAGSRPSATFCWTPAAADASATPYCFTATVTDDNCPYFGSQVYSYCITVTQPAVNAGPDQSVCSGSGATLTASGATTYSWNPGGTNQAQLVVTPAGTTTYTVTGTNAAGCTATDQVTVNINPLPVAVAGPPQSVCIGASATFTAGGGGSYLWNPGGVTTAQLSVSPSTTTTYTVTVTDANGCTDTDQTILTINPLPVADAGPPQSVCSGNDVTLTASGGVSYLWDPGAIAGASLTISPAVVGTYTVTVTDANGCTSTDDVSVFLNPLPVADAGPVAVICAGAQATLTASGGQTYLWNPGAIAGAQLSVSPALTSTYTVTATDANGCTSTATTDITVNPLPLPYAGPDTSICIGDTVTIFASGGGAYSWDPGAIAASQLTLSPSVTTDYTVTVTDQNGCTASDQMTLTVHPLPLADAGLNANICIGDAVSFTASGGVSYVWDPGGVNTAQLNLSPALSSSYTVTVTDANGCTSTDDVAVQVNPLPLAQTSATDVHCNGGADGTATVIPSAGTSPYSYSWSPSGGSNAQASGLTNGSYTVTVTDDEGCTVTATASIAQPTPVQLSTFASPALCHGSADGVSSVEAIGGTPGYTYRWSPSGSVNDTAFALAAGTYTVTVTDANGCTKTVSTTVNEPPALVLNMSGLDAGCYGASTGSASVAVNGGTAGYSYSWSPVSGTTSSLSAIPIGTYTVLVTDAHACSSSASYVINQPTALQLSVASTPATCGVSDGTATVTAQGGSPVYVYAWTPAGGNGSTTTGLPTGIYSVRVTDTHGCSQTAQANIPSRSGPVVAANVTHQVECYGGNQGSASVNIISGVAPYTITWTPTGGNGTLATNLPAGNYSVMVSDVNGCSAIDTLTILQPEALLATLTTQAVHCNNGSDGRINSSVSGGVPPYQYAWTPSGGFSSSASGLSSNTYTLTVTDENGCTRTAQALVPQPPALSMQMNSLPALCNSSATGAASAIVQGGIPGYTYHWSPVGGSSSMASPVPAGTYTLTVRDTNGCVQMDSVTVTEPDALLLAAEARPVSCFGAASGSVTVQADGGTPAYTYLWSPNGETTAQVNGLGTGIYEVTVTDHNHCTSTASVEVVQAAPLSLQVEQPDTICIGQSAELSVQVSGGTEPYYYSWTTGDTTEVTEASPMVTSTYTVTVTDAYQCPAAPQVITLPVYPPLNVLAGGDATFCEGNSTLISATAGGGNGGPYLYSWNNDQINTNSATVFPSNDSTFVVTVNDGCSPPVQDSVHLTIYPLPQVDFLPQLISGCTPVNVDFHNYSVAENGSVYSWNLGDQTLSNDTAPVHTYTRPGTYDVSLTVVSPEGCTSQLVVNDAVTVYGFPEADFYPSSTEVDIYNPVINFVDNSADAITWNWNFGDGSADSVSQYPMHVYADSGMYTIQLIVTSEGGCPDTTYRQIHVEEIVTIYVPNAFTPNGNGVNDGFIAVGRGIVKYEMWIIDRWGLEIFHSKSMQDPWDGTYYKNHTVCQNDVYEYVIDALDFKGKKHRFIGHVTLVR